MASRRNDGFETFTLMGWFRERFARIRRSWATALGQDDLEWSGQGGGGMAWLSFPFRLVWAFLGFLLTSWSVSRPGRAFLFAIPALLVAGAFVGAVILARSVPFKLLGKSAPDPALICQSRMMKLQEFAIEKTDPAERKKLFGQALICARHLVQLRPIRDDYKYRLALLEFELGNQLTARQIMNEIAPPDRKRHVAAHVWQANDLLRTDSAASHPVTDEIMRREMATNHLRLAEAATRDEVNPEGLQARLQLASLLAAEKRYDEAIEMFKAVLAGELTNTMQLDAMVRLAMIYKESGETEEMQTFARKCLRQMSELTLNLPDVTEIWAKMVNLAIITGDFEEAGLIVAEGLGAATRPEVKRQLIAIQNQLFIEHARTVVSIETREDYLKRFGIIGRAIQANPFAPGVYPELMPYLDVRRNNEAIESGWLREFFLEPGTPVSVLQIVLCIREMQLGNFADGGSRLLAAYRRFPATPLVLNKVLLVMCEKTTGQDELLANVASVGIETFPGEYYLYFSRGMFLKKQGLDEQAIHDFELVAEHMKDAPEPLEALAELMDKTGNKARADEYRARAGELRKAIDEKIRTGEFMG
jgi:tetratricopeptide (TPR) repeat protein